jgi:hypothetical protein
MSILKSLCFIVCLACGTVASAQAEDPGTAEIWNKIDDINKTLGPKAKIPPAYKIFQEQFERAVKITRDSKLKGEFMTATDKANDTDDFREVTKLKKRAEPTFILESLGDDAATLLDFKYIKTRAMEGSPLAKALSILGVLQASILDSEPAAFCRLPFGNLPEVKAMKREVLIADLKKQSEKLADGYVKKKFMELIKCVSKKK